MGNDLGAAAGISSGMKRAVFLDRDGVLNEAPVDDGRPYSPRRLEDFRILPGVRTPLERLSRSGFLLIIATNQPDVAQGRVAREVVEAMHERLKKELPLDDIRVCYEIDGPACFCYKPKPGMLLDAARDHAIDLHQSFMVGDRWRDVGCGRSAGCTTIFIDRHYAEPLKEEPDARCQDLSEAAEIILGWTRGAHGRHR